MAFADAWNRGDAEALADLFTPDADFVNVVGLWWTRREQIRRNHAYGLTHIFPGSTMTIERLRVRDLGATAVVHARWRVSGQVPTGLADRSQPGDRRGVFVFVTHLQSDGSWLAVAAQNTDIVPGAQTHLAEGTDVRPVRYEQPFGAPGPGESREPNDPGAPSDEA